jgi:hypothetical protein
MESMRVVSNIMLYNFEYLNILLLSFLVKCLIEYAIYNVLPEMCVPTNLLNQGEEMGKKKQLLWAPHITF